MSGSPLNSTATSSNKRCRTRIITDENAYKFLENDIGLSSTTLNSGTFLAWSIAPTDAEFLLIRDYLDKGLPQGLKVNLDKILRVEPSICKVQDGLRSLSLADGSGKAIKALWHGTRKECLKGILRNGLTLPKSTGALGKAIYFADRSDVSLGYAEDYGKRGKSGYLLLAEVVVGESFKTSVMMRGLTSPPKADSSIIKLMFGSCGKTGANIFDSVYAKGAIMPNPTGDKKIGDVIWPLGEIIKNPESTSLRLVREDQFAIYRESQVQVKYLIKVTYI